MVAKRSAVSLLSDLDDWLIENGLDRTTPIETVIQGLEQTVVDEAKAKLVAGRKKGQKVAKKPE